MRTKEEIRALVDGEMNDLVCRVCKADLTDDDCKMLDHAADVITCTIFDAESREENDQKKLQELSNAISVLKKLETEGLDVGEQLSLNGFECVRRIGSADFIPNERDNSKDNEEDKNTPSGVDSDFSPEIKQIISGYTKTLDKKKAFFVSDNQILQYGIRVYWNDDPESLHHLEMVKDTAKYGGYIDFFQIPGICHEEMSGEGLFWNPSIVNERCIQGHIRTNLSYSRIKDILKLVEKHTPMISKINFITYLF